MDKSKQRESKRGNRKTEEKYSDSDSGSDSDSDYELTIMTPQQRLKEAIRSKQEDRKKGVYHDKINFDE